jgi:hypothetical protein
MWTTIALGAAAGGATAWVWGAISWAVLPWHHATFRGVINEDAFTRAILDACPASGVYGVPAPPKTAPGMTPAARQALDRAAQARMKSGPVVTAIVQRHGFGSVPLAMLRAFIVYALASAVLTSLLLNLTITGTWPRAMAAAGVGLFAGLLCRMTDWNWHGYSTSYALVCVVDHVIGCFLAGAAIALVL